MMMGTGRNHRRWDHRPGFSLGEMLVVVVLGSMILIAVLGVYGRANQAADAVLRKIDSPSWASEVLQLIAEDLGRTVGTEDMTVQIRNGFDSGLARAELVLRRTYHDDENKEQTLQEIVWRAGRDHESQAPGLILYRSYEGISLEDKLLDETHEDWEKGYPFVPICRGLTFFQIQACKGDELVDQWPAGAPPSGVKITISFAEPRETVRGVLDVADYEKIGRTIAIDPTRKIKFTLSGVPDANGVGDPNQPSSQSKEPSSRGPSGGRQLPNERITNEPTPRPARPR
ncbi:MAG: hypothetical protein A2Y76_03015 [Planctomycetes bacterium RBG_13_60_9]|nr:MAG: hypothetical protein A2Y76_03015 [Planctomycetes bacterium RBG_13_60_9]